MKSKIYMMAATAALAIAAFSFVSAGNAPETGGSDTVQLQVAPSPQLVPPAGALVVIRGTTYRVVDVDNGGNLYSGDSEADAVAAADAALDAGTKIAYDNIQRVIIDPTPE